MTILQNLIIEDLGVKPVINPAEEIRKRIDFLKNFTLNAETKGFVLGISGGQDSTLAGKLAQIAVDELNAENDTEEYIFVPVFLPHGVQADAADAKLAGEFIGFKNPIEFNIINPVTAFKVEYNAHADIIGKTLSDYAKGNVKARLRMITQYAIASELKLLVIGTDHAAEAVSGFFTKFGDGAADILPLSGLTKRQGKALLQELDAPAIFYTKKPTADLLDAVVGQPDETELGVTYEQLDDYLEGKTVDKAVSDLIEGRFLMTQHKREAPVTPSDTWWN